MLVALADAIGKEFVTCSSAAAASIPQQAQPIIAPSDAPKSVPRIGERPTT
jgi:hypothetical protein